MKRNLIIGACAAAILAIFAIWWIRSSGDRRVADARQQVSQAIEDQLSESPEMSSSVQVQNLSGLEDLDEGEMTQLTNQIVPDLMKAMYDKYERIINMPEGEQRQALDRIIDDQMANADTIRERMENQANMPEGANGMTRRVVRRTPEGGEEVEEAQVIDSRTEGGERFMLDNTSPEQRAIMQEYIDLLRDRMKQRGIDPEEVPITISLTIENEEPSPTE